MADKFQFSVVMSVYKSDKPEFFRQALDSITVEQTLQPTEIVLVVDGPVPGLIDDIIAHYQSWYSDSNEPCYFNVVRLEKNGGLGNALKVGVETARYDYIARMDSDDISLPYRFEKQAEFLANNSDVDIVGSNISEFIDNQSNIVGSRVVPESSEAIYNYMKSRCPLNHMTVMFRKSAVQAAGGYIDWHYNEDYYLWVRMALKGCKFANLPLTLCNVRVGADMYARRGGYKYFKSEADLQRYMYKNGLISVFRLWYNVMLRFVLQVCMPNWLRGLVFKYLARK